MLTTAELHRAAEKEGLRFDQIEKDYIIVWVLAGLSHVNVREHGWFFKGGTCLRHCYYAGYRFSEDIDFSCNPGGDNLETSHRLLDAVTGWVLTESGIRLSIRDALTVEGDFQIEIPVEYNRGGARRQGLPQVKVHLTFDEPVLDGAVTLQVAPVYPDLPAFEIAAYSKKEIVAEKLRSLLQQQKKWPRPRDLYDLWYIFCKSRERYAWEDLKPFFEQKCYIRGIEPDVKGLVSADLREWNREAWKSRLGPMLKELPDFGSVWKEWVETFRGLLGEDEE
ncbi:MAG TPA: nucleotidyl transferase AbiEii/AbiGii toxin family protein [Syntrophorhabdaceae bacterium]|nr:nucleotidyl transferase AbiEii/AbiGii toxin family protein [Syntrophorhabdaceae bacterium]HQM81060.1 nucleotidyl transferase AbiEii/AbiGii toxin family protein [Syntrophorhabdaceae bacterium]